jgi:hypothetical protein
VAGEPEITADPEPTVVFDPEHPPIAPGPETTLIPAPPTPNRPADPQTSTAGPERQQSRRRRKPGRHRPGHTLADDIFELGDDEE